MPLKKKDFIEIEFTGRVKEGEIFDSNIKDDLKKMSKNTKAEQKPFIFSLGEGMFLKGVDDFLIGKELGEYEIELSPEKAFGARNSEFIKIIPSRIFKEHDVAPIPGATFNFDGRIAKILTVSGGRIIADFNHPLAGKTVLYKIKILRKIDGLNEKIKSFVNFLFHKDIKFEVKEDKIILEVEKPMVKFVELFGEKFKDIFNLNMEVIESLPNKVKHKEKTA